MGAVNTTYTFTATDTITSTKMNNIIDQTTITDDAIIGTTLEVASGQLKVRALGITSNEIANGQVTSDKIADGTIVNADISPTAAIAGTKVSPNFGSQNIVTTGTSTATTFIGNVTGNVTGNVSGSSGSCTGNSATATNLSTNRTNWSTNGTISATVGQLAWKNFGNNHTIFDASQGTTPSGTSCNKTNADVGWSSNLPTLMGWNGTNTHGVRVDSAKFADSATNATNATTASTVSNGAITAAKLDGAQSGDAPIFGVRAWANIDGTVGSVSVRQGGNVSGVVRNQLGRYTITFTTPMPDTNYAIVAWARDANATDNNYFVSAASNATKLAGSFQIEVNSPGGTVDSPEINIMVIR